MIRTHEMVTNVYGLTLPSVYRSELPILRECFMEDCSDIPDRAQPGMWTDSDSGDDYVLWTDGPTYIVSTTPSTDPVPLTEPPLRRGFPYLRD